MLDYAAALPVQGPAVSSLGDEEVMGGKALAAAWSITSVNQYQLRDIIYMGKLVCPGFPMPDRMGTLIYMTAPMAVSSATRHPEGALAFLKSMLDEVSQAAYTELFPSTRAAFEKQLAEAMREPGPEEGYREIVIMSNGGQFLDPTVYLWDESRGERQPKAILYWLDDNGSVYREEYQYALSEEQRDALLRLLDASQRSSSYDQVISGIVQEEAGALFAGQRDTSEVARRIQARVELYLAEQG
jgi:ABC-type glycerol-3-phosphate transport system substrate-binding protein